MSRVLVAYDTTEGHTRTVARRMADAIAHAGHDAETLDLKRLPAGLSLEGYHGVLLGGSIHLGKHSRRLVEFVSNHKSQLESVPTGLFSVSLSAAGSDKERSDAKKYVEEFLQRVAWTPDLKATFAGRLAYREYGFIKRWMMKKIARDAGKETDTSKNHEYTDWDAVDRFVHEFLDLLGEPQLRHEEQA